jgi:pimeloyl-ACP methyl ester carboxylesterase
MIILHGLYGMSDNWLSAARVLSEYFEVYLPDQRNHGRSPHDPHHNYEAMRNDLLQFMDDHHIDKAVLVGHSMGGKTSMFFAMTCPERVNALVVIDISPRSYMNLTTLSGPVTDHMNIINGMLNVDLSKATSREDVDRQLALIVRSPKVRRFLLKNLESDGQKGLRWRINLETLRNELPRILEGLDAGPYKEGAGITGFPVLFIKGGRSEYITDADQPLIRQIFPYAGIKVIPDAGHWLHAEQPELLMKTILDAVR